MSEQREKALATVAELADMRRRVDPEVHQRLAVRQARVGASTIADCPACPGTVAAAPGTALKMAFPPAPDQETAQWLQEARSDLIAYLDNQEGFRPPSTVFNWPCQVDELALRRMVDALNFEEESSQAQVNQLKIWEAMLSGQVSNRYDPMGNGRTQKIAYKGTQVSAVSNFKDGRLHGEATFGGQSACYQNGSFVPMNPCNVD